MRNWGVRVWASVGVVVVTAALLASAAGAAGHGGRVDIYIPGSTVTTPILITGAITDYGKTTSVDKAGKPDDNGDYEKVVLQKGGFWVDATALNKKLNGVKPTIDKTNCYFAFKGSGPTKVFKGTGAYAGISGNVNVNLAFVEIGPRLANGKCNLKQSVKPAAQYGNVTGSGTVSY